MPRILPSTEHETHQSIRETCRWEKPTELTDHVFPHVSHGVEFLLTDLTGEFLFCISMDDLDMFMKGPELLEWLVTGNTLGRTSRNNLTYRGCGKPDLPAGRWHGVLGSWRKARIQTHAIRPCSPGPTPISVCPIFQDASFRHTLGVWKQWQQ